ncbi:hypothetical protein F2P56_008613 [Juglans regia]|uniref:Uncharacterized protein LOC108984066 n=2 Tax=Juglans regia TaxID=51240 RepID=A0A2I4DWD0_JUGRE|nr:uncharacterized protein LOC108984066 [Juglans regia]KAF5471847.1 hypothetical protein F2P56_008613 [Juglans regia]
MRFGKKGKLSPRYIPFEILERIGAAAYRLALPPHLSAVHNVFHVSMLRKYALDPTHVLEYVIHVSCLQIRDDFSYEEIPMRILAQKAQVLRNRTIQIFKWSKYFGVTTRREKPLGNTRKT